MNISILFSNWLKLKKINKIEDEIEKDHRNNLFMAFKLIEESIDKNQKTCPLCDSVVDWQATLKEKIEKLAGKRSELLENRNKQNPEIKMDDLNKILNAAKELENNKDLLFDMAIAPTAEEFSNIQANVTELEQKNSAKKELLNRAKVKFDLVLNKKDSLENDLEKYFNVNANSISYDDQNYIIKIKFPREVKTYSTGEINLITFLYSIYSYLGSDKKLLVLDDPVSSLDMINQYKIAFEIVNNMDQDKRMMVLTHSVDFLNIINSQYKKQFNFLYLEELNGKIYLDSIKYNNKKTDNPNIITLDKLTDYDKDKLIDYLKNRDIDKNNFEVLHYSLKESKIDNNEEDSLSNHKLVKLIDNFNHDNFNHGNFYENSYNKILYLVAIRVWIEKKLFETIDQDNEEAIKKFFKANTLEQRISYLLPNKSSTIKISNHHTLKRENLMCKKVMLNQCVHFNSQIAPFAFAINLSLDDLISEIESIKSLFV